LKEKKAKKKKRKEKKKHCVAAEAFCVQVTATSSVSVLHNFLFQGELNVLTRFGMPSTPVLPQ